MKKALSVFAVALLIAAIGVVSAPRKDAAAGENPGIRPQQETMQYPGADNITVYLECQYDGRTRLRLQWSTYYLGIQFVDLSLFNNGWSFNTFLGIGPFSPSQNTAVWDGLVPGQRHYLRINTLTWYGWEPSQTITFLSRNDCYGFPFPQPQPPIPPYPLPPYPPPNPGPSVCSGTSTPATYQAGNCPPSPECPTFATILIYPPPPQGPQGCVFIRQGTGATLAQGQLFEVCYWVNQPMYVRIVHQGPNGAQDFVNGYDDGRGGCVWSPTPLGGAGGRSETLYGPNGQILDTTTFNVQ